MREKKILNRKAYHRIPHLLGSHAEREEIFMLTKEWTESVPSKRGTRRI